MDVKPFLKWLVLKGTLDSEETDDALDHKSLAHPFMPLAFGYESTGRARCGLFIGDEPCQNAYGDGDAMFGTLGNLVTVPPEAQVMQPARREFRLGATDISVEENRLCLAILGLLFVGMQYRGNKPGPTFKWLNMHGSCSASSTLVISANLDFPFMPVALAFTKTARCEVVLRADGAPFMDQAADISAVFGTLGNLVVWPERARKVYEGKQSFSCDIADLSGSTNVVDVSILGLQFKD